MGFISFDQLSNTPIDPASDRGGLPMTQLQVMVIPIVTAECEGGWRFGEAEIAVEAGSMWIDERYRLVPSQPSGENKLQVLRMMFRSDKDRLGDLRHLATSEYPYHQGLAHGLKVVKDQVTRKALTRASCIFKPGSKKGVYERPDITRQSFDSAHAALAWLESHDHDYWDTRTDRLTAGIVHPDYIDAPNPESPRVWEGRVMTFAVCGDLPRAFEILLQSERSSDLMNLGRSGELVVHVPNKGNVKLKDEAVHADSHCYDAVAELMMLSIRQALAGPYKESAKWFGKPVMELASLIFGSHLYNCVRTERIHDGLPQHLAVDRRRRG